MDVMLNPREGWPENLLSQIELIRRKLLWRRPDYPPAFGLSAGLQPAPYQHRRLGCGPGFAPMQRLAPVWFLGDAGRMGGSGGVGHRGTSQKLNDGQSGRP